MHRWKFSVLAAAAVAAAGLYATDASALALGRITVQSALGEPLRAEIDLPQITPAEAETLKATTATPEVFRAQGMEYTPTMNSLQVQLQRRADGSAVLRLSSDRPVNDPFVDIVLDASWGSGRLVRSYTMLFDPPALRRPAPAVTAAPQITPPAPRTEAPPAVAGRPSSAAPATPRAAAAPRPAPAEGAVTVQAGDTAGRIANANRPAGISLDQMLVAMQRANPDAFIQGNINRIKAGAVLQMPDQAAAQATPSGEARQILAAQSRDFGAFRRKLAESAPSATVASAERSAKGSVQTRVEDSKPATAAPDKLTLSKGSVQGQKAAEDQLAKDKQASDASARMAELSKNISDLNKLGAASAAAPSTPAAPAAAPAAPAASAPVQVAVSGVPATPAAPEAPPVAAASEAIASASAEASAAPAASDAAPAAPPAAPASKPIVLPTPAPVAEPGFLDGLMDDPMIPLAGGGLLALLLGYGAYRMVQRRRNNAGVDSSFLESRIQPDSFFGASGGQRVDTANSEMTTGSSMAYSPSQLDAGGDVDPVAEADVYLAYGRDLQAEEILKEAIRHNPARVSVHVKLAEIYAKRQDRKALESVAGEVFKLTQGEGPDWARIVDLGRGIEPENPLYQPGGRPGLPEDENPSIPGAFVSTFTGAPAASAALPPDLDLDLDLDLPDDALTDAPPAPPGGFAAAAAAAVAGSAAAATPQRMEPILSADDFDLPDLTADASWNAPAPAARTAAPNDELTMAPTGPMPLADAQDSGPMDFDLGELSLDLTAPSKPMAAPSREAEIPTAAVPISEDDGSAAAQDDPLATKLALAEEFNAIGDTDGARTLIEEVVAESSGALRTRAQRMLAELG